VYCHHRLILAALFSFLFEIGKKFGDWPWDGAHSSAEPEFMLSESNNPANLMLMVYAGLTKWCIPLKLHL